MVEILRLRDNPSIFGEVIDRNERYITIEARVTETFTRSPEAFEPVHPNTPTPSGDVLQPGSFVGGEVEGLVDRLIEAVEHRGRVLRGVVTRVSCAEAEIAFQAARTTLLSRLRSTPPGGSGQRARDEGRRPDGPGLSSSGPSPAVSAPAGASIPGASARRNIWGDVPADPRALRLSIEELDRAEGLCLHEIEHEVSYLESVDLVLHEVKRLRWRPIEAAPVDGTHVLVGRVGAKPIRAWFENGRWWMHGAGTHSRNPGDLTGPYAPTHWMPLPPAPGIEAGTATTEGRSATAREPADEVGAPGLTLRALHAANIARQAEWCPDQVPDLSFRGNELAGEVGEACNIIKKLERERHGWRGSRASKDDLAQELADVVICADLCAVTAGIDLDAAVVAKFNATSEKQGLATMLGVSQPSPVDGANSGGEALKGDDRDLFDRLHINSMTREWFADSPPPTLDGYLAVLRRRLNRAASL